MNKIKKLIEKWEKERVEAISIVEKSKPGSLKIYIFISMETTLSDCIQDLKSLNSDTEK